MVLEKLKLVPHKPGMLFDEKQRWGYYLCG